MAAAKLKIGLVLDTSLDTTEGVPQYVVHIGEWLRSEGHDVHYLVGETKRRDLPNIHSLSHNIAVSFNGSRTTIPLPTSRRKLRRFMAEHHFDVLHVQTPHHPLMAQRLILYAAPGTAIIGTFHILPFGWLAGFGNRLLGIWLKPSLKRFDKIVAVSPAAAEFCRRSFKVEAGVLPNVVDYKLFHEARPLPQYDDGVLTILFLGRLMPRKGCQVLLEATAKLIKDKTLPEFRVVICGKGPLENHLRQFAAEHGLQDIVTFAGFVPEPDKPSYYAAADLAVFPSRSGESFGIVLLEAMAGGHTAVLAGDNPGYHSVMSPQPGLLFPPTDAGALADKLTMYLTDQNSRKNMAEWGEQYAKTFDVSRVGDRLLDIYLEALHKRRKP